MAFSISDVFALPTAREEIVYRQDQVHVILGHEKFVWVKNGFIFQVIGAGYIGLNIVNDLASNEHPFAKDNLAGIYIGFTLFLIGTVLYFSYHPYIHLGKKYHIKCVSIAPAKTRVVKTTTTQ